MGVGLIFLKFKRFVFDLKKQNKTKQNKNKNKNKNKLQKVNKLTLKY